MRSMSLCSEQFLAGERLDRAKIWRFTHFMFYEATVVELECAYYSETSEEAIIRSMPYGGRRLRLAGQLSSVSNLSHGDMGPPSQWVNPRGQPGPHKLRRVARRSRWSSGLL